MNFNFNSNSFNQLNPNVKRQKFGLTALLLLIVVGAVFTIAGVVIIQDGKIDSNWTRLSGTVVGSNSHVSGDSSGGGSATTYNPIVGYQVNGQTYKVTSSVGSSSVPVNGAAAEVAYNPDQPDRAKVVQGAGNTALMYSIPIIGILCLLIGPIAYVRQLRRSRGINQLTRTGQKLTGVMSDIQTNSSNDNSPTTYKIVVTAANSAGVVQSYVSDKLIGIGGLALADFRNTPIPIDVYVSSSNPSDYYVDIADIPNLTPQRIAELIKSVVARPTQPLGAVVPSAQIVQSIPSSQPTQLP